MVKRDRAETEEIVIDENQQKIDGCVHELLNTEQTYLQILNSTYDYFFCTMQYYLTHDDHMIVFANYRVR